MAPPRSQTNVPGHIGIGFLTCLPSAETLGRLIPQEPVVVQSAALLVLSDILAPPLLY